MGKLLNPRQAAAALGVSIRTVYRAIERDELAAFRRRHGGRLAIPESALTRAFDPVNPSARKIAKQLAAATAEQA